MSAKHIIILLGDNSPTEAVGLTAAEDRLFVEVGTACIGQTHLEDVNLHFVEELTFQDYPELAGVYHRDHGWNEPNAMLFAASVLEVSS